MTIMHSQTLILEEDIERVSQILGTGQINDSHVTRELEERFKAYLGSLDCRATNSGTAALIRAIRGLDLPQGSAIFVSSYVCEDVVEAITLLGHIPVFIDINDRDLNICPQDLRKKIELTISEGLNPGAVIVAHMFGFPADIDAIRPTSLPIIEDVAHALGSTLNDLPCGALGAVAVFSFHALKVITAGEGGMVAWNKLPSCDLSYTHDHLSNINSALAISQFNRLSHIVNSHQLIHAEYKTMVSNTGWYRSVGGRCQESLRGDPSPLRFVCILPESVDSKAFLSFMAGGGVVIQRPVKYLLHEKYPNPHSCLNHCPVAKHMFQRIVSLPAHLHMTQKSIHTVASMFYDFININV